jgi:hypothetical protein
MMSARTFLTDSERKAVVKENGGVIRTRKALEKQILSNVKSGTTTPVVEAFVRALYS